MAGALPECTSPLFVVQFRRTHAASVQSVSYTSIAAMFCRALHLGMGTNVETSQDVPIDQSDANFLESICLYGECIAEQVLVLANK